MEKQINREQKYKGKILELVVDDIELDNNRKSKREIVLHNGGACVALKDIDDKFFLVKQYRYAHSQEMLEFCAGKIESCETPEQTIKREVVEELGYTAKNLINYGYIIPTCGYSSEKIYLFYGEVDKKLNQNFDDDEFITVEKYTFDEIEDLIKNNIITDAKTISLVYKLKQSGIEKA